ncbi:DUF2690 domain-containing protein [Streptomyces lincolnensis]|uniref:DUF2690 domain-containing protein n=1 Tax=Streptomyces lincolnensis TaxID=1915 RepID=UPI0009A0E151|nr:DUF2690 domain-containing protein [Streptomyces lincolnensis]QMV08141.1 DUF2690 domain-containing protein [Streptomyces lincolnensis]
MRTSTKVKAAAVAGAAMTAVLIPLGGTSYAAGCNSTGCDNKGPMAMDCSDQYTTTARTVNNNNRIGELRWSSTCDAAWVRVYNESSNPVYNAYGYIEKYNSSGTLLRSLSVAVPSSGNDWSNMLGGASYQYRICIKFQGNEYPLKCSTKF